MLGAAARPPAAREARSIVDQHIEMAKAIDDELIAWQQRLPR
jgi:hypothetical protein